MEDPVSFITRPGSDLPSLLKDSIGQRPTPANVGGDYIKVWLSGGGIIGGHLGDWLPQSAWLDMPSVSFTSQVKIERPSTCI